MRILDKRHDYYDGVLVSESPIWSRYNVRIPFSDFKRDSDWQHIDNLFRVAPVRGSILKESKGLSWCTDVKFSLLLFCGKFYPVYSKMLESSLGYAHGFSPKQLVHVVNSKEHRKRHIQEARIPENESKFSMKYKLSMPFTEKSHTIFMTSVDNRVALRYNISTKTPMLLISSHDFNELGALTKSRQVEVQTNPLLGEFGFQRIFDPWQTAQMIEQFLTNELAQEEHHDFVMTDELKIHAAGFDVKTSFRKQKESKKR